jgi:hypothetical protein
MSAFLLVACVCHLLGGVLRVGAALPLGRIRYRCRSFNMAQDVGVVRVKTALLIVALSNNRLFHLC